MSIDLLSNTENFGISPRISFSYDLCQTDLAAVQRPRSDSLLLESNDFDFCTSQSFQQDAPSSCAEELFSDGKILPQDIKKQQLLPPKPPAHQSPKKESLKDIIDNSHKTEDKEKDKSSSSRSFWRFKRSSSCGNGYTRSLICSLPLLLRSNSTGSAPNPKPTPAFKSSTQKHKVHTKSSLSPSSSFNGYPYSKQNKNGIRVSPVLNVPPPYISRGTVNLFGLGSLFCSGKDKKKKRSEFL